jgi:glucose/arabinose dehydrogenase/subtilisin-like proprotein convertase family protein
MHKPMVRSIFVFALSLSLINTQLHPSQADASKVQAPPSGFTDASVVALSGSLVVTDRLLQAPFAPGDVATVPANFADATVTTVSGNATGLEILPDGRLLITSKEGQLTVFQNGVQSTALDLAAQSVLCSDFERGLQSVTADPDFASNNFIYVFYTRKISNSCAQGASTAVRSWVVRYTLSPGNVASAPFVVLENIPSQCGNHNGGDIHFGPQDGLLYISVGDSGCDSSSARYLSTLSGKILRVAKDGSIPASNPYANDAQGVVCGGLSAQPLNTTTKCKEIFASGLRNPFRFAVKHNSANEFYINDVGASTWEEVSVGAAGADYGWNVREGKCFNSSSTNCPAPPVGMTDPIYAYSHSLGCSITGGAFVVSAQWPAQYNGYYFGDYCDGDIKQMIQGGTVTTQTFSSQSGNLVNMMFDPVASALYYTLSSGEVRKITYTGGSNRAPTASATANPTSGSAPLAVSFDGSASSDPDGNTITGRWDFGDGSSANTLVASHTYAQPGIFIARLVVTDSLGLASAPWSVQISVGNDPPEPTISAPAISTRFAVGQVFVLSGSATDPQDGTLDASRLSWRVLLHHVPQGQPQNRHTHPFFSQTGNNATMPAMPEPEDLDAAPLGYFEIQLTATDLQGLTRTVTQTLLPNRVPIGFETQPSGLQLSVNGTTIVGPQTLTAWANQVLNLNAPSPQALGSSNYGFASWSDSGAASHSAVAPANAASFTANFSLIPGPTNTPSPIPTSTATPTNTPSPIPTSAATPTHTPSPIPTSAATSTNVPNATLTRTPTHTAFPSPTRTPANTTTPRPTATVRTPTPTRTPILPTATPMPDFCAPVTIQPNASIPDNKPAYSCFDVVVNDLGLVTSMTLKVAITHTYVGDVRLQLRSPNSMTLTVLNRPGHPATRYGDSSNLSATYPVTFAQNAANNAELMGNILLNSGTVCRHDRRCTFAPNPNGDVTSLSNSFAGFVGLMSKGTWQVCMADASSRDLGTLQSATLDLVCAAPPAVTPVPQINEVPPQPTDEQSGEKPEEIQYDVWLPLVVRDE